MKTIFEKHFFYIILYIFSYPVSAQTYADLMKVDTIGVHQKLPPLSLNDTESEWQYFYLKGKVKSVMAINYHLEEKDGKVIAKDETGHRDGLKFDKRGVLTEWDGYCDGNSVRPCEMTKHTFDKKGFIIRTDGIDYGSGEDFFSTYKNDSLGRPVETEYYAKNYGDTIKLNSIRYATYNSTGKIKSDIHYEVKNGEQTYSDSTLFVYHSTGRLLEKTIYVTNNDITEIFRFQYNSSGKKEQERIYEWDGRLQQIWVFDDMGYTIETTTFDKTGNITYHTTNPVDKDDMRTDESDSRWGKVVAIEFDKNGNWISKTYSDMETSDVRDAKTKTYLKIQKPFLIIKRTIEYY